MSSKKPDYTLLDHTADLGIKIRGTDLKNLFESAGQALIHLMLRGATPGKTSSMKISVPGVDLDDLMVRWLGEILYLFEGEHLVVNSINIHDLTPYRLEATLKTVPFDPQVHEILSEIKAVTYHQIEVANKGDRWEARVIFDI
ncbi:MAG: archease [Deltaproteobacteria bacterium]|nr:archease [Deltaproteobacteria bacterium]